MNPASLRSLLESPRFNSIDRHLAARLLRLSGDACPELGLAAALVSRALADGHSCIQLADVAGRSFPPEPSPEEKALECPARHDWESALLSTALVGPPGADTPLILDRKGRLYLHRYWAYEQAIAYDLSQRRQGTVAVRDPARLKDGLARLFPGERPETNWQKVAAFTAVHRPLTVITGGPGTGKTWTVARILGLLLEQPDADALRVRLAAPTGKAAARLQESLAQAVGSLPCSEGVKARLSGRDLSATLHRLLGTIPNSVAFRHDADHPLPLDVLIVDEASMISLSLMARLLAAFRRQGTRLILVGDKDQLPPVDPGGVLADLCRATSLNQFTPEFCTAYVDCGGEALPQGASPQAALMDTAVQLQVNHRSGDALVLNALSARINAGAGADVTQALQEAGPKGVPVAWQTLPAPEELKHALEGIARAHYLPLLDAQGPAEALAALARFRILCAVREGPYGMRRVNELVAEILAEARPEWRGRIRSGVYPGRPVMVTANHYTLKLFNGDTGVYWPGAHGALGHFPDETGAIRAIGRERLPEHETAYSMTVHKSQGSEFDHVLLVLPSEDSPLLTRELIYTGLTRARKSVHILAGLELLSIALQRQARRQSGLTEALAPVVPQ